MDPWIPHKPETWPWRFATVKRDVMGYEYQGYWAEQSPVMKNHLIPKGTTVKIVMVSRFGDVGITDDLAREFGYRARVSFDDLAAIQEGQP